MAVARGHDFHVHCVATRQFSVISNVKVTTRTIGDFLDPIVHYVSVETSCSRYVERYLSFVTTTFNVFGEVFTLWCFIFNLQGNYDAVKVRFFN